MAVISFEQSVCLSTLSLTPQHPQNAIAAFTEIENSHTDT